MTSRNEYLKKRSRHRPWLRVWLEYAACRTTGHDKACIYRNPRSSTYCRRCWRYWPWVPLTKEQVAKIRQVVAQVIRNETGQGREYGSSATGLPQVLPSKWTGRRFPT